MSAQYNILRTTGVTGAKYSSVIGKKEPLAHPSNCRSECPYGFGRAYCFPCYAKIVAEHRAAQRTAQVAVERSMPDGDVHEI